MAQKKGHTGNPNGRPKGTPNKVTTTIRMWLVELINDNRAQLQDDLSQLEPRDRLAFIEKILPFILPKVERADEVEGACYGKDDVITESTWGVDLEKTRVKSWFEE